MGKTVNGWKYWAAGWCIRTCCERWHRSGSLLWFRLRDGDGALTMLRYGVTDLRSFFENDLRSSNSLNKAGIDYEIQ